MNIRLVRLRTVVITPSLITADLIHVIDASCSRRADP